MRIAVVVGNFGLDVRWSEEIDPETPLLRLPWRRFEWRAPLALDSVIARSVDQAFDDFAREMEG